MPTSVRVDVRAGWAEVRDGWCEGDEEGVVFGEVEVVWVEAQPVNRRRRARVSERDWIVVW